MDHIVPDVDLAAEVERLRALLEQQPSCLLRVGVDGTMLAASDAAISLFGARSLSQLFERSLIERLQGDGAALWLDFVVRVRQAGSASAECDMDDLSGQPTAVAREDGLERRRDHRGRQRIGVDHVQPREALDGDRARIGDDQRRLTAAAQ